MLRTSVILLAAACLASAASVDQNAIRSGRIHGPIDRDVKVGDGGGSSSYSSASSSQHVAAPSTYGSGGGGGGGGGEQGNLYYYYYPVEEYGNTEAADAGFDVFTAIILPLLILGGLLLALSSFTFNFTSGRSMDSEPGMVDQLHGEVERIFYIYLNAFESEECIQQALCETGIYAKTFKNKEFYMSMVEPFVPETMKGNVAVFKMAAKDGFDVGKCKKYRCHAPKIFQ